MWQIFIFIYKMIGSIIKTITGFGRTKMVFIVRTDLQMSSGKIASQCAHAAILLYESALNSEDVPLKSWMYSGQPKIVLKVDKDCEITLKSLHESATYSNLNTCLVYDAGRTELESGTITVLGIGPNYKDAIDKYTKHLKLL